MAQIYISSTYKDLKQHREKVYRRLRQMRHDVIAMEDDVATDQRPLEVCQKHITESDLYIGIIAWRYGYVPAEDNPDGKSITELEFRHAKQAGKPCFIFLLAEDCPWPPAHIERGEGGKKLEALRAEFCARYEVSSFHNEDELAGLVGASVHNWNPLLPIREPLPRPKPLPDPLPTAEPNLGLLVPKTCDRLPQEAAFATQFRDSLKAYPRMPQIYFVHGRERECHDSFIERLAHQIGKHAETNEGAQQGVVAFKQMAWPYVGDLPQLQQQLLKLLFDEFAGLYLGEEQSATALSQLPAMSRVPFVVIQHRIDAAHWNREARELLNWYIAYWAKIKIAPSRPPQFLIFLSIVYPKSQPDPWWKKWRASKQVDKEQIEREIHEISQTRNADCPCLTLHELSSVSPNDVKNWFNQHRLNLILSENAQYDLLAILFTTDDGLKVDLKTMADIEDGLRCIVGCLRESRARQKADLKSLADLEQELQCIVGCLQKSREKGKR